MIKESKWSQFGKDGLIPKCITVHNSGDYVRNANDLFDWLNDESKDFTCHHYLVDAKEVIQLLPLTWKAYNTGKGDDYAFNNAISVCICSNLDNDLYLQGQEKAIELIKDLMKKYNIPKEELYFHKDWNPTTYCPCNILDLYKTKKNFLEKFF